VTHPERSARNRLICTPHVVTSPLGPPPVAIDEIVRQPGLPAASVQPVLLELECAGGLARHVGARVALL
jgi:DNA processing protein